MAVILTSAWVAVAAIAEEQGQAGQAGNPILLGPGGACPPLNPDWTFKKYNDLAVQEAKENKYSEVLCALQAAYATDPQPILLLYNAAQAHQRAGRPKEAVEMYTRFLKAAPLDNAERADAERYRAEQHRLLRCPDGSPMPDDEACPIRVYLDGRQLEAIRAALKEGNRGTPRIAFFAVAGAAVVGLAVGTGVLVSAEQTQAQEQAKPQAQRSSSTRDTVYAEGIVADTAFVLGGALAAGATILAFTTRWRNTEESRGRQAPVTLVPLLAPSAAGMTLAGRF